MNYWLDLFTGTTWNEFRDAGANVSGFRPRKKNAAAKIQPGDVLLCYLTGVMRWVGALEVIGPSTDKRRIWKGDGFPVRLDVKPLMLLEPDSGVPMSEFEGRLAFYQGAKDRGKFKGFLRGSPNLFRSSTDGELILSAIRQAQQSPIIQPVDPKKLFRQPLFKVEAPKGRGQDSTLVSIPAPEESEGSTSPKLSGTDTATTRHTEIQYELLRLGSDLGLDVWVARNDRSRKWNGSVLGAVPNMLDTLPTQFNDATNRTIELIDVLWLSGNSIVAAFEVECTTSIYSGLLRMSDLLSLQPNLNINLYLVAPDERREKVAQEILRPTFGLRETPLARVCGFLAFSRLLEQIGGIRKLGISTALKPTFLRTIAEYFAESQAYAAEA